MKNRLLDLVVALNSNFKYKLIPSVFDSDWGSKILISEFTKPIPYYKVRGEPETSLNPYLIFHSDQDGAIYVGKGPKAIIRKIIKTHLPEPDDDFENFYFGGKGPYFTYVLEEDDVTFFPSLKEALGAHHLELDAEGISNEIMLALEKKFLGHPLYITDIGDMLMDVLK
jgi:hypothetical protein